jgi:hypothetical protein
VYSGRNIEFWWGAGSNTYQLTSAISNSSDLPKNGTFDAFNVYSNSCIVSFANYLRKLLVISQNIAKSSKY